MKKTDRQSTSSGGCLTIFGVPFFIAGLVLTFIYFNGYRKWLVTQSWVETPCWIESAELETTRNDGTTYKATASYRYDYQGTTYRSNQVSIHGGSDNVGDFQQNAYRELAQYAESMPEGRDKRKLNQGQPVPFRCFVNPNDPQQAVIYRVLRWPLQSFLAIFTLTFPAIGAGLVFGGVWATREVRREEKLQSDFPEQPWKWKKIWSADTIPDGSRPWQSVIDLYSLWAAAILTPLILATATTGAFTQDWHAWLLLIPVGLWAIPASATWRGVRKRWTMGASHLYREAPFVAPGSQLAGEIVFGREVVMPEQPSVQLLCEKKVTYRSSDGNSTSTETVWRSEGECMKAGDFMRNYPVSRLPISVTIPINAKESATVGDTEYKWRVTLEVPGTAVAASFEIPVFHTETSRAMAIARQEEGADEERIAKGKLPARLSKDGIHLRFHDNQQSWSLMCEPARLKTLILSGVVFNVIWSSVAIFLVLSKAPWIFKLVWPLTSIGIWGLIAWHLLNRRTSVFDESGLAITNEIGPWKRTRTYALATLTSAVSNVNMHSGRTRFYQVQVIAEKQKKITVVDGIQEEVVAKSIADLVSQWLTEPRSTR